MNQNLKLSLFFDLGVKPMKDIILHHPHWFIRCGNGNVTIEQMENVKEIKNQQEKEKEYIKEWNRTHDGSTVISGCQHQYIEAIPEKLTPIEIKDNLMNLYNDYGEIEAVKDIEASYD